MESPSRSRARQAWALAAFLLAVGIAAGSGALATKDAAQVYGSLDQPSWAPPSWLFGPVWSVLYVAMAVAGWRLWRTGTWPEKGQVLWWAQLGINALWSPLFFALGWRLAALGWIVLLDALVVWLVAHAWRRDRLAASLLAPYLAWILFATCLNAAVWWLNR